ncbi:MAG: SDR family oxidoreductase [Gemmatimonadota bacterium]|nr:SDR family oxidoreductase [Gemmatimonadota bacterium]
MTGSTGFVGKVVLEELLRRRDELGVERVYLLIRSRTNKTALERFDQDVVPSPCFSRLEAGWRSFCHPVAGDITEDGLGLSELDGALLRDDVTHIIHCAASVRFDLPIAEAARINITGALEVLSFAQSCSRLARMVDVSTAYVTPHPGESVPVQEELVELPFDADEVYAEIMAGQADEKALLAETRHANTYTFTKCIAEALLARRRGDTPLTLLRPSVVSACRRYPFPGWIDSRAAYAAFVSLLGAGHLRVIRVDPNAAADVVPCDDVADRILSCAFDPALQEPLVVRHAVAGLANSGTLSRLAYTHERHFKDHPHERAARWAYVGRSKAFFRFNEWMHHHVPLGTATMASRLKRQRGAAKKIRRLANVLGYLDKTFYYFGHHTFDFRTAFPPLENFDLESYLESISYGISEHLLKRDPRQAPLRMHGTDWRWALRQPEGNSTQRAFAYFMRKALRAAGAEITFNETEIKAAVSEVREGDLVVLAPSHRSYMDFLVTSLLCFAHPGLGLRLPRVAATDDFSRIPIVGSLLQGAGAFYIKRGLGGPDPALNQQIAQLVRAGHSLEFYPEGTRSRSRRFLAPKRGILRALQQAGRPAVVLPLSISYDRIAEEEGFLRELDGRAKHKGGLAPLAKWTMKLIRGEVKLGRIHIRSGPPLRLEANSDVKALSHTIVAELQRHTAVTTFHISAFCHRNAELGIDPAALHSAIARRGGEVIESKLGGEGEIPPLLQRTYEGQWMHLFYADALARAAGNVAVASHIQRNGFWFPEDCHFDDEITEAVLQGLFAPICRDYQRVAQAVEAMPNDSAFTAYELVHRLPGTFLRDVEDTLEDLTERGFLAPEGEAYRWANGSSDLAAYRNDCVWHAPAHSERMIS